MQKKKKKKWQIEWSNTHDPEGGEDEVGQRYSVTTLILRVQITKVIILVS